MPQSIHRTRSSRYTYDADGNRLTETTYPKGIVAVPPQSLNYTYGYEDELLEVTNENGTVVDQYSYDWQGNVVQDVTPTGTTNYSYDAQDNLISVDDGTNDVRNTYDGAGGGYRRPSTASQPATLSIPSPPITRRSRSSVDRAALLQVMRMVSNGSTEFFRELLRKPITLMMPSDRWERSPTAPEPVLERMRMTPSVRSSSPGNTTNPLVLLGSKSILLRG